MSPYLCDGLACKASGISLSPTTKKIANYFTCTSTNAPDYWTLLLPQCKVYGLLRTFPHNVFYGIHDWYGEQASIQPLHIRDPLVPDDNTFSVPSQVLDQPHHNDSADDDMNDPLAVADSANTAKQHSTSNPLRISPGGKSNALTRVVVATPSLSGRPNKMRKGVLPLDVIPEVLSSSETGVGSGHTRPINTIIRRKNMTGHSLIGTSLRLLGRSGRPWPTK